MNILRSVRLLLLGIISVQAPLIAQSEFQVVEIINLDPEAGRLSLEVAYPSDFISVLNVPFGYSGSGLVYSFERPDRLSVHREDGSLYYEEQSPSPNPYKSLVLYNQGKGVAIGEIVPATIVLVEGVRSVLYRSGTGSLYKRIMSTGYERNYENWTNQPFTTVRIDEQSDWWVLAGDGRVFAMPMDDTLLVGQVGNIHAIRTTIGIDSATVRLVNLTKSMNVELEIDGSSPLPVDPFFATAATPVPTDDKEHHLVVRADDDVLLDTTFVPHPFQMFDVTVGEGDAGQAHALFDERISIPVVQHLPEYLSDRARLVVFQRGELLGKRIVTFLADNSQKFHPVPLDELYSSVDLRIKNVNSDYLSLSLIDSDGRAIKSFDMEQEAVPRRVYLLTDPGDGSSLYSYDPFNSKSQALRRERFGTDTFSITAVSFARNYSELVVRVDDSDEEAAVRSGLNGTNVGSGVNPPTPFQVFDSLKSGISSNPIPTLLSEGSLQGTDGGTTILLLDDDVNGIRSLSYRMRPEFSERRLRIVNFTENFDRIDARITTDTVSNAGLSTGTLLEGMSTQDYSIQQSRVKITLRNQDRREDIVALWTDSTVNDLTVLADGGPEEGEIRIYLIGPGDLGTGAPLLPYITLPIEAGVPVDEPEYGIRLSVFPNPARNHVVVSANQNVSIEEVILFDLLGRRLFGTRIEPGQAEIRVDLQSLPGGVYHLMIRTDSGGLLSGYFVRE